MKKYTIKSVYLIIIAAILLLLGIAGCLYILRAGSGHYIARVYQHGELMQTIDLDTVTEPYTFEIHGDQGACNTVEVRPGEIAIISATCPDKVCVNVGFIRNEKLPITCMPNQVVIQLEQTGMQTDAVDGVTY